MITAITPESILENYKQVIQYARIAYRDSNIHSEILESIDLDSNLSLINGENESINEATNVTDAKIVHEGKGTAISVKIDGKEYRYVSAEKSTAELFHSFMGMLKHANAGYKALGYLQKHGLEYYGNKQDTQKKKDATAEARKILGLSESEEMVKLEATQPSDIPPNDADDEETKKRMNESLSGTQVINTAKSGMSFYDDFLNSKDHDYKRLVKGLQGNIIMMSPDEYIDRLGKEIFHCSRERVLRGVNEDHVQEIANKMAAGTKYDIPILNLAQESQEGRHRAMAAKKLGVKEIPVLVVTEWNARKELKMPKCMTLFYGHTIEWTRKDGTPASKTVGLNLEKIRAAINEILKSGDYKK